MDEIFIFLETYRVKILTLHILGTALGLGGATISDILFFKFLKDYKLSQKEVEVLHIMKNVVLAALLIILITGFAIYLPQMGFYNQSGPFLVKVIGVGVITLNGILLHAFIAPHLIHVNLKKKKKMGRNWYRLAFALGAVSFVSWYSVFLIAMLKSILPFSFGELLTLYLTFLALGIVGSQLMEVYLSKKARIN